MKTLLIATLLATALPAQNARLVVTGKSSALSSGSLCDAWSCVPGALDLMPGEGIQIAVSGGPGSPLSLLVSAQSAACLPIPGIDGSLIVQFPLIEVPLAASWGRFYGTCQGWIGFANLALPVLPIGSSFVLQGLLPSTNYGPALTNAARVTIR